MSAVIPSEGKEFCGKSEWSAWPELVGALQDTLLLPAPGHAVIGPSARKELKWDQAAVEHVLNQWYSELEPRLPNCLQHSAANPDKRDVQRRTMISTTRDRRRAVSTSSK